MFAKTVFKNKVARLEDKLPGWERNFCKFQIIFSKFEMGTTVLLRGVAGKSKVGGQNLSGGGDGSKIISGRGIAPENFGRA